MKYNFSDFIVEYMWPLLIFILFWIWLCIVLCKNYSIDIEKKTLENFNGNITKLEYKGHTYVGWTCNLGAGLVHDPDCECKADLHEKKEK